MTDMVIENEVLVRWLSSETKPVVPSNIKKIGRFAFADTNVKEIILSDNIQEIERGAFYRCTELQTIIAPNVTAIGESAFENCENLEYITVSSKLKEIGENAFNKCSRIVIRSEKGSYAETYANKNYIFFETVDGSGNTVHDNEKISLKQIAAQSKASEKIKPMLNLNMMVLGGSGTGKSRFLVKPNLMQCNTSFVVTDPSGELLQSCGKMLEREGYRIKVFNINDMKYSNNYNPFHYLKDASGKYNENNVIKMINTFMMNTKDENASGGDQFWDDSTRLLLSSLCFLLIETAPEEEQNFANVLDLIHKAKVIEGKEEEKSELDLIFDRHREDMPNALSCQYYDEFKQAAGKTMQSILISTTTKLQHFKLEQMRNLTCMDNIHLEELGDCKTALFIIIPSTDTTYNFLAAMMYTQLFDSLYNRAITKYHGRLPVHVRFLLDEFANVGKIPDFDKVLATCRKFEISVVVILQNLSQLKRMYEKSWEELPGNCDTMIFLGGKDQFTNEYLMKSLGKETIDTVSINKSKGQSGSTSYNDGILGRELMQLNELETMENSQCIVMIRGLNPFLTDKFEIKNHRRYHMLDEAWDKSTMGAFNRNQYIIENIIHTEKEMQIIDLTEWIDDDDIDEDIDFMDVNINWTDIDEDQVIETIEEQFADVAMLPIFDDVVEVIKTEVA